MFKTVIIKLTGLECEILDDSNLTCAYFDSRNPQRIRRNINYVETGQSCLFYDHTAYFSFLRIAFHL